MPKPLVATHLTPPAEPRPGSAGGATPSRAALPGALSQLSFRTPCRGLLGKTSHTQVMKQVVPFRYSQYSAFAFFSQNHRGCAAPDLFCFCPPAAGASPCRGSASGGIRGKWRQPVASRGDGGCRLAAGGPGSPALELGAATPAGRVGNGRRTGTVPRRQRPPDQGLSAVGVGPALGPGKHVGGDLVIPVEAFQSRLPAHLLGLAGR